MKTLLGTETVEETIKRSRFIAIGAPITSVDEAMNFIEQHRHADAGHHCWAYRLGQNYRFNDDGEPSGTAGKPIYHAMEQKQIDRAVIMVIRYFGGIKLGTGGLIRAYGGSASALIRGAELEEIHDTIELRFRISFAAVDPCRRILTSHAVEPTEMNYLESGVVLTICVRQDRQNDFKAILTETVNGDIEWLETA